MSLMTMGVAWKSPGRAAGAVIETGHEVLSRMTTALTRVAAEGGNPAVIGDVGSLTLALSVLCGLGGTVWGAPLPHAVPFVVHWDGTRWHCPSWPGG